MAWASGNHAPDKQKTQQKSQWTQSVNLFLKLMSLWDLKFRARHAETFKSKTVVCPGIQPICSPVKAKDRGPQEREVVAELLLEVIGDLSFVGQGCKHAALGNCYSIQKHRKHDIPIQNFTSVLQPAGRPTRSRSNAKWRGYKFNVLLYWVLDMNCLVLQERTQTYTDGTRPSNASASYMPQ